MGLRVAALDALLDAKDEDAEQPVVVVSAVALSEKVPDPALRPHGFTLRVGELLIEAKRVVKHGGWIDWLQEHCD